MTVLGLEVGARVSGIAMTPVAPDGADHKLVGRHGILGSSNRLGRNV